MVGAFKKLEWQAGNAEQESYSFAPSINWSIGDKTNLQLFALHENQPKAGDRNFFFGCSRLAISCQWPVYAL